MLFILLDGLQLMFSICHCHPRVQGEPFHYPYFKITVNSSPAQCHFQLTYVHLYVKISYHLELEYLLIFGSGSLESNHVHVASFLSNELAS